MQQQADVTAVKLEEVNAAIRAIEDKAHERHQSQAAELGRSFAEFGASFKTHLSTEQLKQAKHVESSMQKLATLVETQHGAFRTHMAEQISEVRGEMKNTISKDVPNFVGAMIAETVKGGHGMRTPDGGGKSVEFPDTARSGTSSFPQSPSGKSALVGYVVFDATRGETETGNQSQLTIPMPVLRHVVATVVAQGTPDTFKTAVLDSIETIPSEEPLTSLLAGNLVRQNLQNLAGASRIREDQVTLRVVENPAGWTTSEGLTPQFLVFVLRDFTSLIDVELKQVLAAEAERDAKYPADAAILHTMLVRSERWAGDGHNVRTQLLQLIAPLLAGVGGEKSKESYRTHTGVSSSSAGSKIPKLSDSPAQQLLSLLKEWKEENSSIQSYHYDVVKQCVEGLGTVMPYLARLPNGLDVFQAAVVSRMVNSAYGGHMSARLLDIASREDLAMMLRRLQLILKSKAPNLPNDNPTDEELAEFADICKTILNNIRAACFGRYPIEQGRYEAQQLCNRRPDGHLFPTELHWLVTSVRGCLKLLDLVGKSLLPTIVGSDLSNFLGNLHEGCTTGEMKRRILSLADDFIAGTHEALNVKAASLGKALVSLHMYVAGLRSKAYGSMQHSSLDEGSILALAEPTGEFNAGVRVEKTFFHTSWDLKIINCVDIRAFLLVVERNIIQPSPGAAGIGLLAPMSSTTLYVGGQCHDPLQVCSSDSTSSQLLAVETEAQPSEAEELRSVIAKGLSDAAERHGQYHMEQLQTIGTLHQKVQEETRLAVAAAAATQLQAMEDRLNEFKRVQAEASSKYVDGQRSELAAQAELYHTQLDNVAAHTELGKLRHAGGGALRPMGAPGARHQTPAWAAAERREACASAQCSHSGHQSVLAVHSAAPPQPRFQATAPGARAPMKADARGSKGMRLPGVRPRAVRKDEEGKIIMRYTDKPPTQWDDLPRHIQSPYLVSQGFDQSNWIERSKQPCGICGAHGETDHSWNHCLYLWACTEKGRLFFGEAKASERAQALLEHGVRSVRDMRQQFTNFIAESVGTKAAESYEASVHAVQQAAELNDDDSADEFFGQVYDATLFVQRLDELCAQVSSD